jgi:hypothetical protein
MFGAAKRFSYSAPLVAGEVVTLALVRVEAALMLWASRDQVSLSY